MCLPTEQEVPRTHAGQATVEAAVGIPVLFVLLLMLLQPGIILYDRMVMSAAAAEGCRLLATRSYDAGMSDAYCIELIKRHLGAIPPHQLFHVHEPACTWHITVAGGEHEASAQVGITNKVKLLPLLDAAAVLVGLADAEGCLTIQVAYQQQTQPNWVHDV